MADRWAFVVGIDRHLDPGLGTVPYAEAGAKAVAEALAAAGFAHRFVLLGQHATRTGIESRLRKLKRSVKRGDDVLAYFAGRGFARRGAGLFGCWDTLPDDIADTSLPLADLFAALTATKAERTAVLLDAGAGSLPPHPWPADVQPHLDPDELAASPIPCLSATDTDEPSHAAAVMKSGLWTHLVAEAFAGRAGKAVHRNGTLTAGSLHGFLKDELPRLLRKHFEPGTVQTPRQLGDPDAVLADLSALLGGGDVGLLGPERLRRVAFRSESTGRVKELTGWRKTFDLPTSASQSSRRFVAKIAATDVKADLDQVFEAAREHLGYKRKDLDASAGDDGVGVLRSPDFEYTVTAALDRTDPTRVAWRREATGFADPGFVRGPGFAAVFGKLFDQLAFEFAAPVDVAALVDRLEDRPVKGAKVAVASDGRSCDVSLAGFAGRVTVDRHALTVRGRAGGAAGLLDQFLAFLRTVGPVGETLALGPAH